jgi:hypothetical protein
LTAFHAVLRGGNQCPTRVEHEGEFDTRNKSTARPRADRRDRRREPLYCLD